jgi:hypothetical protein
VSDVLRIANCSGFYGDRLSAAREMVLGGPIDVLTGDYLAELTMMILARDRQKGGAGYARTFLKQMEEVLATCIERGIKIVANAGGLNPSGLAQALEVLSAKLGIRSTIAYIEGDDLLARLPELQSQGHELRHMDKGTALRELTQPILTANAYLGAWGIADALRRGADVVVCPRVTDAALSLGPAAWRFNWPRDDWDRLAGGIVAGHIIECGAQCTGGNFSAFDQVPEIARIGFPIVEVAADGSSVVTKHPNTGGMVTIDTVKAQLLYEIQGPRYLNPDVTTRLDTLELEQLGPDRVRISGARGEPPPSTAKVCINYLGGYRNEMTFVLSGLDIEKKARVAEDTLWQLLGGRQRFAETHSQLIRTDRPDPESNEATFAYLRVIVKDSDADRVGRAFSSKAVEMALANYPGFFITAPPGDASPFGVLWPALIPAELVVQRVVVGGVTTTVSALPTAPGPSTTHSAESPPRSPGATGGIGPDPTMRSPLGAICGARSGDKGGNATLGVWANGREAYFWLEEFLTAERLRGLIPEAAGLEVERHALPNLSSLLFVIHGILGDGVAASTRTDPMGKSLGEYLRARHADIPQRLLPV